MNLTDDEVAQIEQAVTSALRQVPYVSPLISDGTKAGDEIPRLKTEFGVDLRHLLDSLNVTIAGAICPKIEFLRREAGLSDKSKDNEDSWGVWRSGIGCEVFRTSVTT
jgi:hypothetical protein